MSKVILVPLDGSELAERAIAQAEQMAADDDRIVLVRAALTHTLPGAEAIDAQVKAIDEATDYLKTMAAQVIGERRIAVETAVPYGAEAGAILEEVRIRQASLIVMATHGRSGLGRWLFGSVAETVLRRSPVPVLMVRAWEDPHPTPPSRVKPSRRLLVPLDGSAFAEAALPAAGEMAARTGAELILLRVITPPPPALSEWERRPERFVDQEIDRLEAEARGYLLGLQEWLAVEQPRLRTRIEVRVGAPADEIVNAGLEHEVELVAMATHGRTGLSRAFLGSVAGTVLRLGSIPLLLVRPIEAPVPAGPTEDLPIQREALSR